MLSSYTTRPKRRRQDLNLRRSLNRSPLAEECFQPLSHFSSVGRAGIEPATNKGRFYRALPTPIGEPTQNFIVPTGFEPAIPRLKAWWLNHLPTAPYLRSRTQGLGFEPRTTLLESAMLPLHHPCMSSSGGICTRISQGMNLGLCVKLRCDTKAEVRIELTIFGFADRRLQPLGYSAI